MSSRSTRSTSTRVRVSVRSTIRKTKGCHVLTILSPVRCPFDMADVGKPFGSQQRLGDISRSAANAGGPFRAARSWFPGSPPRPTSAASRLALGQRRPSYALATASAFPQQAGHLPRPINHLFSARDGGAGPSMARQVSLNSGLPGSRQARCCCQASSATSPTAFCGTRRSSSVRPLLPARIAASAAGSTPTSSRPSCARLSRTLASGPS